MTELKRRTADVSAQFTLSHYSEQVNVNVHEIGPNALKAKQAETRAQAATARAQFTWPMVVLVMGCVIVAVVIAWAAIRLNNPMGLLAAALPMAPAGAMAWKLLSQTSKR